MLVIQAGGGGNGDATGEVCPRSRYRSRSWCW